MGEKITSNTDDFPSLEKLESGQQTIHISIIIPARNESSNILNCIKSISEQDYEWGSIEIIIADGDSDDNTIEIIQAFINSCDDSRIDIRILENVNRTAACGMNLGFRNATGDILMPFSAHAYMEKSFLRKNIECLISTDADVCGGIVKSAPDNKLYLARAIGVALNTKIALGGITARTGTKTKPFENPSFGAYKRELFDKYGYLDENLMRNSDYEFNLRLKNNNVKIMFSPEIISYYYNRPSLKRLFLQYFYTSYYKAFMIGKYPNIIRIRHLIPSFYFLSLIVLLFAIIICPTAVWGLLFAISIYLLAAFLSSISKPKYLFILPVIYFTIHAGYGFGIILGFIIFKILRREPRTPVNQKNANNLSRNA